MKKNTAALLVMLTLFVVTVNAWAIAQMGKAEQGMASSIGIGEAQIISLLNTKYEQGNIEKICRHHLSQNRIIKNRGVAFKEMANKNCREQLLKIGKSK